MSPSSQIFGLSPSDLAKELSPTQFEFLLQAYIRGHALRNGLDAKRSCQFMLMAVLEKGETFSTWEWQVGSTYSEANTKGELLEPCMGEQARRLGFAKANKLSLIEGPGGGAEPAPPPIIDDQIPF